MRYKCPKCGNVFEGELDRCPKCGSPMYYNHDSTEINHNNTRTVVQKINYQVVEKNDGSFGGGFVLAFFFGIFATVIIACVGKKDTKQGAAIGFAVQAAIGLIASIIYAIIRMPYILQFARGFLNI